MLWRYLDCARLIFSLTEVKLEIQDNCFLYSKDREQV
jgi:hypothetical protein